MRPGSVESGTSTYVQVLSLRALVRVSLTYTIDKWMLGSVCLEIVLILIQDRCMVCMEHTKCVEINLDAHDGTPR